MSDKTYNTIKNTALFATPILSFLGSLVTIWAAIVTQNVVIPAAITATLTAIDTALGAIVIVAKKIYDEGQKKQNGGE